MDTGGIQSENAETRVTFRKLFNDVANRNYRRRHSPVNGSPSLDGSPKHDRSSSPVVPREDVPKASQRRKDEEKELNRDSGRSRYEKNRDSCRHSDGYSSRSSHGYSRNDDYSRRDRRVDDGERHYQVSSLSDRELKDGERGRSRDYARNVEKYSCDRYDNSGHRRRDKERESSEHQKLKDKDFSPDRVGSGRKYTSSASEEKDRYRNRRDRDVCDERRDHHSSGDHKSDRSSYYEETRWHQNDSSGRNGGHRLREHYKNDPEELNSQKEKKKHDNWENSRGKNRYSKAPGQTSDDKSISGSENQESPAKKPKLSSSSSNKDPDYNGDVNEKQPSSSLLAQEVDNKINEGQTHANSSEAAKDFDAAKVAAMKAAELVNRNLVGGGFMSTEQKKKLLWGNKKCAAPEEPGCQWDTAMFGDRDRREIQQTHGFKGRCKGGAQTRQSRCGETKGTPDGSRETIYCWASTKRWPHCWIGSLSICLRSYQTLFSDILLQFCARITIPVKLYLLAMHALGHLTFCLKHGLPRESFSFKPMKSEGKMLLLGPWFWEGFSSFLVSWFNKGRFAVSMFQVPLKMPLTKVNLCSEVQEIVEEEGESPSLLDLPELALECILERLSPAELCSMAGVCNSLRDRCRSDHLWEKHLKHKWGRVICEAACKEWQCHIASRKRPSFLDQRNQKGFFESLMSMWPFSWYKSQCESRNKPTTCLPVDSIMALYLSLESGKFWFPAQVYNRENGHVGFMLSCYDAQLSYDSKTDTFQARYSPFARRTIEESIHWDRLRAPPVETPAHVLHTSDCLNDLKPGDHIEIQWRRSKEFPYGWWYAVVGHQELCDGNENRCRCRYSDTVVLEFSQYTPGSRWRRTIVNRKDHREVGNEADGFYGGIRKLYKEEEISKWKQLWPKQIFD